MKTILIGIDGGATKISAYLVEKTGNNTFVLSEISTKKNYSDIPGFIGNFSPLPLQRQLEDYKKNEFHLTDDEIQQGAVYVEACAQVIESIVRQTKCNNIIAGIGMPGLKTSGGKGIAVLANGPRMPQYVKELEERLSIGKVKFSQPIKRLGSDADYCGIGENYAENGFFGDVQNAYYIGLGTGAADALKINGSLLPFDQTKVWLAKTWEMKNKDGMSLESIVSARGIQKLYAKFSNKILELLDEEKIYADSIIQFAEQGDNNAQRVCKIFVETLSDLLLERIVTLYTGWKDIFSFVNPQRQPLAQNHPYINIRFEHIIIGQRVGTLMKDGLGREQLTIPLLKILQHKINTTPYLDKTAKAHYANIEKIITFSNLRAAPALGAAIDAVIYGENNA